MANRWGKSVNSDRFFFPLGSKITVDDDCSHEIKRRLLLGRKAMTNLDSILKSRDITLLTNAHLIKAMVFPVVMYECVIWTVKAGVLKNWRFRILVLDKTLESPLDSKEMKLVNPKGNQPWIFIGQTDDEADAPTLWPPDELTHWKRPWCWERLRAGGEGVTEDDSTASQTQWTWFEQTPGDSQGQGSLACCSPWGHKQSDKT